MPTVTGQSSEQAIPGVFGENTAQGDGVFGQGGDNGRGVVGVSTQGVAVVGTTTSGIAIYGEASENGRGVVGVSKVATAVEGNTTSGIAIYGEASENGRGVVGVSKVSTGVAGTTTSGIAIYGEASENGRGVVGVSKVASAVEGNSTSGAGVWGTSQTGVGIFGKGGGLAGQFEGNVLVSGKLTVSDDIVLANADCAEDFDIVGLDKVEPGTVMVIDADGALRQSDRAYDKRVAGVISGAGNYKPGIVLDKQESSKNRMPIALMGKVYCKVDASYGAIEVGDLLTTSSTSGHAMRTDDPMKAFGAVIGKALRPLKEGQGLIPILIALQ